MAVASNCDSGWVDATSVEMGCLYFKNAQMNYWDANVFCQDRDSHLVAVYTPEMLEFLVMEMQVWEEHDGVDAFWWSGATDMGREGLWYWQYSLLDVGDFIWGSQQPENSTEYNYLCFLKDYDYMGAACDTDSNDIQPICQKPANEE